MLRYQPLLMAAAGLLAVGGCSTSRHDAAPDAQTWNGPVAVMHVKGVS